MRSYSYDRISPDQRPGEMPSAGTAAAANRALDGLHGVNGIEARLTPYGLQIEMSLTWLPGLPHQTDLLKVSLTPTWCLHDGVASFRVADLSVEITTTGYVVARKQRAAGTMTLVNRAGAGTHLDATHLEWTLCKVLVIEPDGETEPVRRCEIEEVYHIGPFYVAATL